jgi:hypothetical protein
LFTKDQRKEVKTFALFTNAGLCKSNDWNHKEGIGSFIIIAEKNPMMAFSPINTDKIPK